MCAIVVLAYSVQALRALICVNFRKGTGKKDTLVVGFGYFGVNMIQTV